MKPLTRAEVAAVFDALDAWDDTVTAALKAMALPVGDHDVACPVCGEPMHVLVRTARLTWAGREPPCVQFHCKRCAQYGEYERAAP